MKKIQKRQKNKRHDSALLEKRLYKLCPDAPRYEYKAICPFSLPHDGIIAFAKEGIVVSRGKGELEYIEASRVSKIRAVEENGCVFFECTCDGAERVLCRSDNRERELYRNTEREISALYAKARLHDAEHHKGEPHGRKRICPVCERELLPHEQRCSKCSRPLVLIKRLFRLTGKYRRGIVLTALMLVLTSLVSLALPQLDRILVDEYINAGDGDISYTGYALVLLSMVGVQLALNVLSFLRQYFANVSGTGLQTKLATESFEKVQSLSLAKSGKYDKGELYRRINSDIPDLQWALSELLPNYAEHFLKLLLVGIFLFMYDARLALFMLLPIPLIALLVYLIRRPTRALWSKERTKSMQSSRILHDIYSGIRVVKAYGTEKHEFERYDKASREYRDITKKNNIVWTLITLPSNFLMSIGEFLILYFAGNKVLGMSMSLGELAQLSAYSSMIYAPLREFAMLPRHLTYISMIISKLFELLDEELELKDADDAKEIKLKGSVELSHLGFSYDGSREVLHDIDLSVKRGEMIGIVGRSGAGKTTLINLIMRLYDPTCGAVLVDGKNIRELPQESYRSQIGAVLQETYLFSGTVRENIAYAKPEASYIEVVSAAKAAGAHSFIVKLPDAYDTKIGEHGYTLSGGERQRIAIARALLRDPAILILDEATSSLDTETERKVQDALARLTQNRTTFAIAHRLSTLRNATRLIVLDRGTIAESGTHDELMQKRGIYYSLVNAQREMVTEK